MVLLSCMLSCLLTSAPRLEAGADWQVVPRLSRGEELVYRGTYTEEATGPGVQHKTSHRLEHRVFVLDATPQGIDAAFLTVIHDQPARASQSESGAPISYRLETAHVSPEGRMTRGGGGTFHAPLHGPTMAEYGTLVEMLPGRLVTGQSWEVPDAGRPARTWRVAGAEAVNDT